MSNDVTLAYIIQLGLHKKSQSSAELSISPTAIMIVVIEFYRKRSPKMKLFHHFHHIHFTFHAMCNVAVCEYKQKKNTKKIQTEYKKKKF